MCGKHWSGRRYRNCTSQALATWAGLHCAGGLERGRVSAVVCVGTMSLERMIRSQAQDRIRLAGWGVRGRQISRALVGFIDLVVDD